MRIAVNCSRNISGTRRGWEPLEETSEIVKPADATAPERHAAVRELVERLPQTLREVCALFYFAEHSCREVAEILQMNESAVKVALHLARKKLLTDWRCAYE